MINIYTSLKILFSKVEEILPPKGEDFKKIKGPRKTDRIGIVGAGPAGVHMAFLLKEKGFLDVTIIEKSNRIGGKADFLPVRGTKQETGVVALWNNDFNDTLVPLLEKFGFSDQISSFRMIGTERLIWTENNPSVSLCCLQPT